MRRVLILIVTLVLMEIGAIGQMPVSPRLSPKEVVERFCKMEAEGKHLTPDGWRDMSKLLISSTANPRLEEMAVIKDYIVSEPVIDRNRAKVSVVYTTLGVVDPRNLSFGPRGPYPIEPVKITFERTLILTEKYTEVGPGGAGREMEGPPVWRIEGQAEPHISVQTAIDYLQRLRIKTSNDAFSKSADESISALRKLQ
ncbi:MAG: hypothetical protein WAL89_11530 [Candidatus Sulfotelmatobacter sp.]